MLPYPLSRLSNPTLLLVGVGEGWVGMDGYRADVDETEAGVGLESRNDAWIALLKSSSSLELATGYKNTTAHVSPINLNPFMTA